MERFRALSEFYYVDNFQALLDSLMARYPDLLSSSEVGFIEEFGGLPAAARGLLVRMIMRNGIYFRSSKLVYREIGATADAMPALLALGWVQADPPLAMADLQKLLTKAELSDCFALPRLKEFRRKAEICEELLNSPPGPQPFSAWYPACRDSMFQLMISALCERFRLMFFGNFRQDLREFILADLGVFAYEQIDPSLRSRAFATRVEIDTFVQLFRCRQLLEGGACVHEILQAMPAKLPCGWIEERRQRLLFDIAKTFERDGQRADALALLRICTHPEARLRAVRLHERAQEWVAADALLNEAGAVMDAQMQQLQVLRRRVDRKLHAGVCAPPAAARIRAAPHAAELPACVPKFELVLERTGAGAVEYEVRDYLAAQEPCEAQVHYVENALINSLFGLLFWRAIFAPVSGAFFHAFHRGPADLASPQFCQRRPREIADAFALLDEEKHADAMRSCHERKYGIQSPFVSWGLLSESLLERALSCFPAQHLKRWFEWILRDIRANRAGFPDLVQFWPQQRRYRMIEVKGPGDRLQSNQRRLFQFCLTHGMPVSVCQVRWAG